MEKLSLKKKLLVIRLYFEGLSYDEIAVKAGVGKGTVGNVITEVKAGRFPEFGSLSEQIDILRELGTDLKRTRLTPIQAAVGISVLSRLQELGIEPNEIEGLSALCQTLNADGIDIQSFIRATLVFEAERKLTGLSIDELETKVKSLEESATRLEPLAKELMEQEARLTELTERSEDLAIEVSELEEQSEMLQGQVNEREQRETELSNRVRELEDRAQSADERLTAARKDLKMLSGIGMSLDNLFAFTHRLKVIAQRHGIKSEVICSKLMDELEQLDDGLGLDTITKTKRQELRRIEGILFKAKEESSRISGTNEKLRQERSELKAVLSEERRHITNNIVAINRIAENTIAELETAISEERRHITKDFEAINLSAVSTISKLKQDLTDGIQGSVIEISKLKNQTLQLGKELGQFNEMIESNKWLKGLQTLVKGDEEVEPSQVRVIGTTVMQAMLTWLDHYTQDSGVPWLLRPSITNLIGEFERWKP